MRIALITDLHFGARADSLVFADHFVKFFNKQFFPYLKKHNIKTLIHLGDLVDRRKYINVRILNMMREQFIDPLNELGINVHTLLGNHDIFYKNTSEINSIQEIVGGYENWTVHSDPTVVNFDGISIAMLPWINKTNEDKSLEFLQKTRAQILMGHLELEGFEYFKGIQFVGGMEQRRFRKFDIVCSGHFHHKHDDGHIFYLGSPYEMTFADYNDPKGFHIFDTETRKLEFIENPKQIFHKIYYNDKEHDYSSVDVSKYSGCYVKVVVVKKKSPYMFDKLIDALEDADAANVSISEDMTDFEVAQDEALEISEDTITILQGCVDDIDISVNKEKLKGLLYQLYNEAINQEIADDV